MRFANNLHYLRNEVLPLIRAHGWTTQNHDLPSGQLASSITYTVGMTEVGLSELAMSGVPHEPAAVMLNFLARLHVDNALNAGDTVPMPDGTELKLIEAPGLLGPVARALYGIRATFLQVMWPDGQGRYPNEPGWPHKLIGQQLFVYPLLPSMMPTGDGLVGALDAAAHRQLRPGGD